jgi:hypothetical protein
MTLDIPVVENARFLSAQTLAPPANPRRRKARHGPPQQLVMEGDSKLLQKHFGSVRTVFGKAVYRPSGSLLRIDGQEISDTTEGRAALSRIPPALSLDQRQDRRIQSIRNGVAAFFGTWGGRGNRRRVLDCA